MFRINQFTRVVLFIIMLCGLSLSPGMAQELAPTPPGEDGGKSSILESSQQIDVPQDFQIERHNKTGLVRFLTSRSGSSLAQPKPLAQGISALDASFSFLEDYGELFGLDAPRQQLQVMRSNNLADRRSFLRFQQVYQEIPIMGAELIVQLDPDQKIRSVQAETLADISLDTQTQISPQSAIQTAIALVAKTYHYQPEQLRASQPELWIYSPILLGAPGPELDQLVWRMEISGVEALDVRELVLVNAHLGNVALNFSQIENIKYRLVYDNQNDVNRGLPGTGPVRIEGSSSTGISDVDRAYDYAGNTYDFYFTHHQRDSIDNKGMEIVSTVRFCLTGYTCPYPNAFWNGSQMVYGQGYTSADDVVAHELTHGVTENESALFYYMQSGAISEAFSDIWGELVDQTYNDLYDNDDPSVRWLIGEDLPGSAVRDMSNPLAFGDPDKMTSPNYRCGPNDLGGVHHNNGVANKAAYLMVDGGTFNGFTVSALGITKTIKIWYEVQTNLLTSAADYQDLNSALSLACNNLIGQDGITESDCNQVRKATAAVEMHLQPIECAATDIQKCNSAIASNTFNGSSSGWTPVAGTWGVDANYYYTEGNPDNSFYSTAYTLKPFGDFEYKVRLRRLGDLVLDPSSNGIIIRGQPAPLGAGNRWYSGYGFYYKKDGYFAVYRYDAGEVFTMAGWQQHPAIATGDAWNDLRVLAQGAHLEFSINGILVWSGMDDTYSHGLNGIVMYRKVGSIGDLLQVDWAYTNGGTPLSLLTEDFENPVRGLWYSSATSGKNVWRYPQTDNPYAFNATYASSGAYNLWGYNIGTTSDSNITLMDGISLPSAKNAYMTFKHAYSFEGGGTTFFDGGILEYSLNSGPWLDANSLIDFNGYTGIISSDYGNPLSGRSAFVDQSDGMITSRLNLLALAGQSVRFRFRIGTDSAIDDYGWFIDDLDIYICENQAHYAYLPLVRANNIPITKFHSSFNEFYSPWSAVAGAWTIAERELKGRQSTPENWGSIMYPIQNFSNIVYTVRMKRAGCDACQNQLIIRGNPYPLNASQNWSSAYSFEYKANGTYSVRKRIAGGEVILKDWTSTTAILKGETWNVLKVVAIGTNLQFYINDVLLWSGTDASLATGQVGIGYYHSTAPWDVVAIDWAQLVDISTLSPEEIARLVPGYQTPP